MPRDEGRFERRERLLGEAIERRQRSINKAMGLDEEGKPRGLVYAKRHLTPSRARDYWQDKWAGLPAEEKMKQYLAMSPEDQAELKALLEGAY